MIDPASEQSSISLLRSAGIPNAKDPAPPPTHSAQVLKFFSSPASSLTVQLSLQDPRMELAYQADCGALLMSTACVAQPPEALQEPRYAYGNHHSTQNMIAQHTLMPVSFLCACQACSTHHTPSSRPWLGTRQLPSPCSHQYRTPLNAGATSVRLSTGMSYRYSMAPQGLFFQV